MIGFVKIASHFSLVLTKLKIHSHFSKIDNGHYQLKCLNGTFDTTLLAISGAYLHNYASFIKVMCYADKSRIE
jgi:hypothetical protein